MRHVENDEINQFHVKILERLIFNPKPRESKVDYGMTRYALSRPDRLKARDMSQASILKYTANLKTRGLISKLPSPKLEKVSENVEYYDITALGVVKWLKHLLNSQKSTVYGDKKVHKLVAKCKRHIPWITHNWSSLHELASDSHLILLLLHASDIEVSGLSLGAFAYGTVRTSISIDGIEFNIQEIVEFPTKTSIRTMEHSKKTNSAIIQVFTCSFIHRMMNYIHLRDSKERESRLISLIKSDPKIYQSYANSLEQIENNALKGYNFVQDLKKGYKIPKGQIIDMLAMLENQFNKAESKKKTFD